MKKVIALLLAVSSLAMSSSALAFSVSPVADGNGASRNYLAGRAHVDGSDSFVVGKTTGYQYLPTYRNGDQITLKIAGDDVVAGATLTFICSKLDGTDYTNYNVQMIDQIAIDTNGAYTCTYKLRNSLTDGLYKLEMRLGSETKTFSFLIGTPSVELLYVKDVDERTGTTADKYLMKNGNAHCFGKATVTGGANFSQTGTEFGFKFANGKKYTVSTDLANNETSAQAVAQSAANASSEINGEGRYFFRMVIEGAGTDANALPDVDVFLND